jgi:hypothetical protein
VSTMTVADVRAALARTDRKLVRAAEIWANTVARSPGTEAEFRAETVLIEFVNRRKKYMAIIGKACAGALDLQDVTIDEGD